MATLIPSVLLQTTVLMVVGLVISRLFRRQAPIRHSILLGTLLCVLVSPLLLWTCRLLDWTSAEFQLPVATWATPSDRVIPDSATEKATPLTEPTSATSEATRFPYFGTLPSPPISTAWSDGLAVAGRCGVGVWLAGTVALSWGIFRSWWKLRQVRRDVLPIDPLDLHAVTAEVRQAMNVQVLPPIVESQQICSPIATGLRQPLIILPVGLCRQLTRPQLRDVLIHEAAHIVRLDDLVVLLQAVTRAVLWPHPLIHLLNRELAAAREDICDNFVLGCSDTVSFAETLLELALRVKANPALPAAMGLFPVRGKLETRVSGLLDERRSTKIRLERTTSVVVALSILALAVASGTARIGSSREVAAVSPQESPQTGDVVELPATTLSAPPAMSSPPPARDDTVGTDRLVEQLQSAEQRDSASASLKALGPAAELPVLSALNSTDYETRMAAYQVLEHIGTEKGLGLVEQQYLQRFGLEQTAAKSALDAIWRRLGDSTVEAQPSARSLRLFE